MIVLIAGKNIHCSIIEGRVISAKAQLNNQMPIRLALLFLPLPFFFPFSYLISPVTGHQHFPRVGETLSVPFDVLDAYLGVTLKSGHYLEYGVAWEI